jgi:hypothetical protein
VALVYASATASPSAEDHRDHLWTELNALKHRILDKPIRTLSDLVDTAIVGMYYSDGDGDSEEQEASRAVLRFVLKLAGVHADDCVV